MGGGWDAVSAGDLPRGAALGLEVPLCRRGEEASLAAERLGVTPRRDRGVRESHRPAGRSTVDAGAPAGVHSGHRGAGGARARASRDQGSMQE